jgi:hypothetical protein
VASIGRWRGFAQPALALLLLFRILIPSGYMIAPDHDGRPGLTLCAAQAHPAAVETAVHTGHDGHPDQPGPSRPGDRPCPFAALAAPPLPPSPPAVPPRVSAASLPPELPAAAYFPRIAPASPPPPATGPPSSV